MSFTKDQRDQEGDVDYGEDGDNYVEGYDEGDGAVGDGNADGGNYGEDEDYNEVNW